MIDRANPLSVIRQCELLDIHRSSVYYQKTGVSDSDIEHMRLIDQIHMKWPFYGSRRIRDALEDDGHIVNRKRVQRLMQLMGISALYPKPKTSIPNTAHRIYPYRLRHLVIDKPNQVWAADITYLPMAKGFIYLVAIMDWYSRKVLSWRISNSMESEFCVEALNEALSLYGAPDIFNTDQGSQFTSESFTGVLSQSGVTISMDGKGRWMDNVFIERLWRSVKYEEVYLKAYVNTADARHNLDRYFQFYNQQRRHQSLEKLTPDQVYYGDINILKAA